MRVSLYEGDDHVATVALSDTGTYVAAAPPANDDPGLFIAEEEAPKKPSGTLPNVMRGFGDGHVADMPDELIEKLVHIFSYDVDYQSPAAGGRRVGGDLFRRGRGGRGGGRRDPLCGAVARLGDAPLLPFSRGGGCCGRLLRRRRQERAASSWCASRWRRGASPPASVCAATRSCAATGFHSGIDWSAPSGTPIIASGNGTVEEVGTRAGYGRSIIPAPRQRLRDHLQPHERLCARHLAPGDRVRQGQIIGYVGSTGLSTGPHLHFEVLVNGRFVDPMKIRLPRGRELQGAELADFEQERQRIDELLTRDSENFVERNAGELRRAPQPSPLEGEGGLRSNPGEGYARHWPRRPIAGLPLISPLRGQLLPQGEKRARACIPLRPAARAPGGMNVEGRALTKRLTENSLVALLSAPRGF